jgi:hypothetical protein
LPSAANVARLRETVFYFSKLKSTENISKETRYNSKNKSPFAQSGSKTFLNAV